jgi:hypothetical protein
LGTNTNIQRTNKGLAWSWLKSELATAMGAAAADALLAGYYARLQDEYKDRRRVAAERVLRNDG